MGFTNTQLEAVQRAIAKGEKVVQYADRSVTYRSMEELLQAEARIKRALATPRRRKQFRVVASKGLDS